MNRIDIADQILTSVRIEEVQIRDREIRISTSIDIIRRAVLSLVDMAFSRNTEDSSVRQRNRRHHAAATARGLADERDLIGILEEIRHKVAAGETGL